MWVEQETLLKQDVAHYPENVEALYNLALRYLRNERYDESIDSMKTLMSVNSGQLSRLHPTTYVAILIDVQRHQQALNLLCKLLEFDMGRQVRAGFLRQYGTIHTARADDEAAVAAFEESIRFAQLDYNSGFACGCSRIQPERLIDFELVTLELDSWFGNRSKLRMIDNLLQRRALQLNEPEKWIDQ